MSKYPVTPDGRYFVANGKLWRCTNPHLDEATRKRLVKDLMQARRSVRRAKQQQDESALTQARQQVDQSKVALGERGPVWWQDGAPDYNQKLVKHTPYQAWYEAID